MLKYIQFFSVVALTAALITGFATVLGGFQANAEPLFEVPLKLFM